jgi:hypothetical protein
VGRIERIDDGRFQSRSLVIELGASAGWEAALFDHFQAVVKTMGARLQSPDGVECASGGSTYTFSVWGGHPYEEEVKSLLQEFRARHSELRKRVKAYNDAHAIPARHDRVTAYGGVCVTSEEADDMDAEEAEGF